MLAYEKILLQYAQQDPRAIIMTAENRAPMRNIAGPLGAQFLDTGITEQTMVGMSAGLALRGRRPVIHALAAFLTMRAFEFIRTDIGIPHLPVKIVGFVPGLLSDANGPTHQAIEDISLMRGIPGMKVFCPADHEDLCEAMPSILASDDPYYIRWTLQPNLFKHEQFISEKAEVIELGSDIQILAYGAIFNEAYRAYGQLKEKGLRVGITNLRNLEPVDTAHLIQAAKGAKVLITVEDHFRRGGISTVLRETLFDAGIQVPVLSLGFDTWFKPALLPQVLAYEKLDAQNITNKITAFFKGKNHA